jgi:hypothetical protein
LVADLKHQIELVKKLDVRALDRGRIEEKIGVVSESEAGEIGSEHGSVADRDRVFGTCLQ